MSDPVRTQIVDFVMQRLNSYTNLFHITYETVCHPGDGNYSSYSGFFPELDNEGVVEDPDDFTPEQISTDIEVTEDMMDQSNEKRSEAMTALSDGKV